MELEALIRLFNKFYRANLAANYFKHCNLKTKLDYYRKI